MYLIVGLGNPEEDYKNTRHNMGFDTINKIAEELNIKVEKKKFLILSKPLFIIYLFSKIATLPISPTIPSAAKSMYLSAKDSYI